MRSVISLVRAGEAPAIPPGVYLPSMRYVAIVISFLGLRLMSVLHIRRLSFRVSRGSPQFCGRAKKDANIVGIAACLFCPARLASHNAAKRLNRGCFAERQH